MGDTESLDRCKFICHCYEKIKINGYTKKKLSVTCHLSPGTYHLSPVTCHLSIVTCHMSPVTCQESHVMCHMSDVTCQMSLQEQPQQQTLPFVTPPQCTVVGPRIPKTIFFKQKKSSKLQNFN